jgi:hypothetical protein
MTCFLWSQVLLLGQAVDSVGGEKQKTSLTGSFKKNKRKKTKTSKAALNAKKIKNDTQKKAVHRTNVCTKVNHAQNWIVGDKNIKTSTKQPPTSWRYCKEFVAYRGRS